MVKPKELMPETSSYLHRISIGYDNRGMLHYVWRCSRALKQGRYAELMQMFLQGLAVVLAALPVLAVRVLRPFLLVRFGGIGSNGRLGTVTGATELYLCQRDRRSSMPRSIDFFYWESEPCNLQLKRMADREIHTNPIVRWLDLANQRLIPGGEKHRIIVDSTKRLDYSERQELLTSTPVHLSFTSEEELYGRSALRRWGIPEGVPFVCFAARDSEYLDAAYPQHNWRYHDYRNCDINNYLPAAALLANRGMYAIRMGAVVKDPLTMTDPNVLDYATEYRGDFLDIYLSAKCKFFLTSGMGIDDVAAHFRRPVACANFAVMSTTHYWGPNDMVIFKKLWLEKESRFLTFREILESGIGLHDRTEQFEMEGLEVIENTSDEITDLALEMDDRINGAWQSSPKDEELQERFWALFMPDTRQLEYLPRIGAAFLRQNEKLLL
jgi:putative glycosyltransferase (TIGR04372 family)